MSFVAINYVSASADIRAAHEIGFIIAFRVQARLQEPFSASVSATYKAFKPIKSEERFFSVSFFFRF